MKIGCNTVDFRTHDLDFALEKIRDAGVLLSIAGGNVLRFSPPLCINTEELDEGVDVVESVLSSVKIS